MTSSTFAYAGQVPTTITVTPSKLTLKCDKWYSVRATVLDQNGNPIKGLRVTWSFASSPSSKDKFDDTSTKTNSHGVAKTKVKLACKPGQRVLKATADGISGTAAVQVKLRHDDDDDDNDHDGDHDDDHDGHDHDGGHDGDDDHDGHDHDGGDKSRIGTTVAAGTSGTTGTGSGTGTSARGTGTAAGTAAGTTTASEQAFGAVLAAGADSLPNTATVPTGESNDGFPIPVIPAFLALLASVAIVLRRFNLGRR
jgi:hypothetical protein